MERDWWKYWFSTLLSCMSTLGFCVIIFLFSGSLRQIVRQFHKSGFPIDRPCFVPLAPGFLGFQDPRLDHVALHQMRKGLCPRCFATQLFHKKTCHLFKVVRTIGTPVGNYEFNAIICGFKIEFLFWLRWWGLSMCRGRAWGFHHSQGLGPAKWLDREPPVELTASGGGNLQHPLLSRQEAYRSLKFKNRIIWDEHPKTSNHQLNAILPVTNQHTHSLEFCMLIVISYVIS